MKTTQAMSRAASPSILDDMTRELVMLPPGVHLLIASIGIAAAYIFIMHMGAHAFGNIALVFAAIFVCLCAFRIVEEGLTSTWLRKGSSARNLTRMNDKQLRRYLKSLFEFQGYRLCRTKPGDASAHFDMVMRSSRTTLYFCTRWRHIQEPRKADLDIFVASTPNDPATDLVLISFQPASPWLSQWAAENRVRILGAPELVVITNRILGEDKPLTAMGAGDLDALGRYSLPQVAHHPEASPAPLAQSTPTRLVIDPSPSEPITGPLIIEPPSGADRPPAAAAAATFNIFQRIRDDALIVLFIERDDLQACSAELSARLATRPLAFLVVMCAPGVTLEEVRATSSDVLSHRVAHVLEHEPHLPHVLAVLNFVTNEHFPQVVPWKLVTSNGAAGAIVAAEKLILIDERGSLPPDFDRQMDFALGYETPERIDGDWGPAAEDPDFWNQEASPDNEADADEATSESFVEPPSGSGPEENLEDWRSDTGRQAG